MAKQLTLDELLECANAVPLPTARPLTRAIEHLATTLGADLAEYLDILRGEARLDFGGILIPFHARTTQQPYPAALREYDPEEWNVSPVL